MSISRDIFDLRHGGVYLPPLILIILSPDFLYFEHIVILGTVGAVGFHGVSRSVFGPGGPEENPLKTGTAKERMENTLRLPPYETGTGDETYKSKKIVFFLSFAVFSAAWTASAIIAIVYGIGEINNLRVIEQILLFAFFVWMLQWIYWRHFHFQHEVEEEIK